MSFGLSIELILAIHVAISLIGIVSGIVALSGLAARHWSQRWQFVFLVATALTSLTGFLFPFAGVTPAFAFGLVSLVLLVVAALALSSKAQHRSSSTIYVLAATAALYLNVVVLIVQVFQKISVLQALAPTGTEWPFLVAQLVSLAGIILLGFFAVRGVRTGQAAWPRR